MKYKALQLVGLLLSGIFCLPLVALAQADFNPQFIISDAELSNNIGWTRGDVQRFLDDRGSYLRQYQGPDASGTVKSAADIIYDAAQNYQINPKYILVTLQKEQSLVTDDQPTPKQLDWAAGYGVCDGCSMDDPKVQKYRGFGKQVDNAAGIMRWYYNNRDNPIVKQKDTPIRIDNQDVTPQSWATAFLYTYTPHFHGNRNFWRIWETWFEGLYPNGTLLKSIDTGDYWVVQEGVRRRFKNKSALLTRLDPKTALEVHDSDLTNYATGTEISFPNYSLLQTSTSTYLLDFDTLRPFASDAVVRALGYNPQEVIDVDDADITGYPLGEPITASTTAPEGVIYQITDLKNSLYYFKDGKLSPITNPLVADINFSRTPKEKRRLKDIAGLPVADVPVALQDGTLIQVRGGAIMYVIDHGRKRRLADDDTFDALGYERANVNLVNLLDAANIPSGEPLFVNGSLISAKNKYLGDAATPVPDLINSAVGSYLVAEYPSGRILSGKNIDARFPMASLTKLVTAYEALEQNFVPDNKILTYKTALHASENNVLKFSNGEKIKRVDAFYSMLVSSLNQSARLVASGGDIAENYLLAAAESRLAQWGADDTTVVEPTGLDPKNVSSARDLLKIFTKVLANPIIKKTLGTERYRFTTTKANGRKVARKIQNSDQLFRLEKRPYKILASKTGYTYEGGATMVLLVENPKTKQDYVVVSLNNTDYKHRFTAPNKMAAWAITQGEESLAKKP